MEQETQTTNTTPIQPVKEIIREPVEKTGLKMDVDLSGVKNMVVNFIVPLISLFLIVGLGIFIIYPAYVNLPKLSKDIENKKVLELTLNQKIMTLKGLVEYQNAVEEDANLVNGVLAGSSDVLPLQAQINKIAKESGLTVTVLSYSFSDPTKTQSAKAAEEAGSTDALEPYKLVNVSLGSNGNQNQLIAFLENMENAARLINVKNFRYSMGEDKETGLMTLTISFALESPYLFVESNAVTDEPIKLSISDAKFINDINKLKTLKYYKMDTTNESTQSTSSTQ